MKFIVTQPATNTERFEYILQNNSGKIILTSPEFANRDACIAAIREVIRVVAAKSSYNVQAQAGQFVGVIRGVNNQIIAQTTTSATAVATSASIDALLEDFSDETRYDVEIKTSTTVNQVTETVALPSLGEIDYNSLYDFEYSSPTGNSAIEPFNRKDKGQYYFHINDTSGKALLYSRGFDSAGRRDKRIRQVIGASAKDQRYEIEEANGQYILKLVERNGGEIARSRSFGSRAEAESAGRYIKTTIPAFEAQYPEPEKSVKKALDQYDLGLVGINAEAGFESLRGTDKQYFFMMKNSSGVAQFFSQGYSSPAARDNGQRTVLKNATERSRYELKEKDGKFYYILRSPNRQEIGRSRDFNSKAGAEAGIDYMVGHVREYSEKIGIDIDSLIKTVTTTDTETFSINLDTPSVAPVVGAIAAGLGAMALSGKAEAAPVPEVVEPEPEPVVEVVKPVVPPVVATKIATPVANYAASEEVVATASSSGGGWWKWLLLAALLLGLLWWLLKGCAGGTTATVPVVASIIADSTTTQPDAATIRLAEPATAPASPIVAASGCNCAANTDPLFNIDPNAKPKSLWRLGSNPEFGNSHALSPEQFYQKLKTRSATNAVDRNFLNRIFKAMGYKNGFVDANAGLFTAVELPKGTIGNIGYSKAHKTLLASLDVINDKDLKAFHIRSANGCDLHFMKTCGNHIFVCNK